MIMVWVAGVAALASTVFASVTTPLSMFARLNTWMPPPPSLTAYAHVP